MNMLSLAEMELFEVWLESLPYQRGCKKLAMSLILFMSISEIVCVIIPIKNKFYFRAVWKR